MKNEHVFGEIPQRGVVVPENYNDMVIFDIIFSPCRI